MNGQLFTDIHVFPVFLVKTRQFPPIKYSDSTKGKGNFSDYQNKRKNVYSVCIKVDIILIHA